MIDSIRLQNFRSYADKTFQFGTGVNIIVGPNASGKTNLLESILVSARGSSYRVKDQELIQFDTQWTRLDAKTEAGLRTVKIVTEPKISKTYEIYEKAYKRLSMQQSLPVVLFEPNHLVLLTGAPELRRNYLDDLLEQTVTNYGTVRRNYRRVLAQRNALLKRIRKPTNEELFPWNLRLSELGAVIARYRQGLSSEINERLNEQYNGLSNARTAVELRYSTQFPVETYETQIFQKFEHNLPIDTVRGFTTTGPHREDFTVFFNNHVAEETASRGETRTLVLALKIIELEILKQQRATTPLLLLDDVFSELDSTRRQALTDQLQIYQTFITTTDADVVVKELANKANTISLA